MLYRYDVVNSGPMVISWVFQRSLIGGSNYEHISESDVSKIYSVTVTNSLDGGAVKCNKCPKGVKNDK